MRTQVTLGLVVLLAAAAAPLHAQPANPVGPNSGVFGDPAVITDNSRNPPLEVDDFLRLIYVPSTAPPISTPGPPLQKRSFFGDTRFYMPPISSAQIVAYAGGTVRDNQDLVAMRCRPANQAAVDPQLAIWPNLARMIKQDFPPAVCPPAPTASTQERVSCLAQGFQDTETNPLIESLYNAVAFGRALLELPPGINPNQPSGQQFLATNYGIGPGHSGIGFVVKDSASGAATATQTLMQSVVPEYLLENVKLTAANCRCVRIPSYDGRDSQPLSPLFVWLAGVLNPDGSCRSVSRILPEAELQ
jgi:hypothetical protein